MDSACSIHHKHRQCKDWQASFAYTAQAKVAARCSRLAGIPCIELCSSCTVNTCPYKWSSQLLYASAGGQLIIIENRKQKTLPDGSGTFEWALFDVSKDLSIALNLCQHVGLEAKSMTGLWMPLAGPDIHQIGPGSIGDISDKSATFCCPSQVVDQPSVHCPWQPQLVCLMCKQT